MINMQPVPWKPTDRPFEVSVLGSLWAARWENVRVHWCFRLLAETDTWHTEEPDNVYRLRRVLKRVVRNEVWGR